ncbi:TonB-dependent receptor [Reichenbachiella sp. MSK19-1]|uniref:SusC/RagA family TonB-linked outer membrane protein n=1 Tax=Reichenbachiella sp. MSK19-1 TaxID=1897631 RepID=UPI001C8681CF|nr:TonB-dependent receptor [Reichenbachiella sp. MSK19-1]
MTKVAVYATILCCSLTMALANESSAQRYALSEITVEVNYEGNSLLGLLTEVESASEFTFAYSKKELRNKTVSLSKGEWNMSALLKEISVQSRVSLRRINEIITIKNVSSEERLPKVTESINVDITVTGTVSDETGEPLPGATVLAKGTTVGTVTDLDGKFTINVSESATLVVSFVGYVSQEVQVSGRSTISVLLEPDFTSLDEIVVVGYGSVKKADLTGSVTQVKLKEVKDIPSSSVEGVLQGRAAGLQIISNSQEPGASSTVRIRGNSTLSGSNDPLVVVDGFPIGGAGNLTQINPADIESVEVLKDASASAIYGSRGANGVIIVTTRKAADGETHISLRQQVTVSEFTSDLNLWRDPVLMTQLNNESRINGGFPPLYIGQTVNGVYYPSVEELSDGSWPHNTRWDDITFRDAPVSNNTTLTISSSNEKTNFNLSGNYFTDKGMYIENDYTKYNYNLNISHKVFDNLKVTFSNILTRGERNNNGGLAYWRNPLFPVYNEDGSYFLSGNNDFGHPVAITDNQLNKSKSLDVISFVDMQWKIIPTLTFTSRFNYKYGNSVDDQYFPKVYTQSGQFNNGAAHINNWSENNLVSESFLNYNKALGRHEFGVTLGHSYQKSVVRTSNLGAFDFVNEILKNESLEAGNPERNTVTNGYNEWELASGIFRANYTFNNKYLFTFTSRADGSSKFGANNKWAFFPSGAISWKAHEESFIRGLNLFDELKFRASYGISGNQGVSPYETLSRFGVSNYYNDGQWITAIGPGRQVGTTGQDGIEVLWGGMPSPDLRWETTAQVDFGVDFGMFNNRLHATFDYYEKYTDDLLQSRYLPVSSGYDLMTINDGSITNKGVELTLDAKIIETTDFQFGATLIYYRNRNEVTDLGRAEETGVITDPNSGMQYRVWGNSIEAFRASPNILALGQPTNVFYGYKTDGIVQTLEEGLQAGLEGDLAQPGEFKYVDINDDGVIDTNDRVLIGNPNPDFMASLNLNMSYKNFDASIFFNGVFGNDVYNTQAFNQPSNQPLRWTPDNPTNDFPKLMDGRNTKVSDWWIEDGSFVRIQNVNLGYTMNLPKQIKARLYMNASNLYTFTKFKGYDPEVGMDGRYWGGYPRLRKWTLGLNVTF